MEQNYLPLFRKYRPQSFKDIVGQENLVKALTNAIELGRIANAYLFSGPRGTGKTSTARIFAKSLNCEHGPTTEPCQKCPSCVDITNATGLDVIEIDAASNRGIQEAKELISQVQYAPINGKYKIYIIDEVHMLTNEAFNTLLKTFEEPPKNVIFILATTEPHKVLETIISRCQRFDLKRITVDDIVKRLREISDIENIKITDSALLTIAKNVSGGLRDSLALLDQVSILGVKEEIDKDLIEELLGKINFEILFNLLNLMVEKDVEKTLLEIDNIYAKGNEPKSLAENFIEFLKNVIMVLNSNDDKNICAFTNFIQDNIDKIRNAKFDKTRIMNILSVFVEYYKEIKISTNPYLWMEIAGIEASREKSQQCIAPVTTKNVEFQKPLKEQPIQPNRAVISEMPLQKEPVIKEKEIQPAQVQNVPSPSIPPQTPSNVSQNVSSGNDESSIWQDVISRISSTPARAFFSGVAKLISVKEGKITLGFLHENALAQAKSPSKLNQLQLAISGLATKYEVEMIKIDSSTKTIETTAKPKAKPTNIPRPTPLKEQIEPSKVQDNEADLQENSKTKQQYSEQVQDMLEQFNGRIIE